MNSPLWTLESEQLRCSVRFAWERALRGRAAPIGFDWTELRARVGIGRGHLVEVTLFHPEFPQLRETEALELAEAFVCAGLGRQGFEDWVGEVRVGPLSRRRSLPVMGATLTLPPLAADELGPALQAAVAAVVGGLPVEPLGADLGAADWIVLESEPEPELAEMEPERDVVWLSTRVPEATKCHLEGQPFFSGRFSRCGERFFSLLWPVVGSPAERLARREQQERELVERLSSSQRGALVGAAFGLASDALVVLLRSPTLLDALASPRAGLRLLPWDVVE